jgi:hypothetical protein
MVGSSIMQVTLGRAALAATLGIALGAAPAGAQLRPLEPAPWGVFDPGRTLSLQVGAGLLFDQTAALAGTVGRLAEVGNYQAAWRSGRVAIEIEGTILRAFHDERRYAEPDDAVRTPGPDRTDSGDHGISTIVRLTPDRPSFATLRFGARLPNSNNRIGLDRDQTDFFALLGGQLRRGPYRAAAEAGLGILGTRRPDYEQSDVLVYTATLRREGALLTAVGEVTGHRTPHMIPRGNEDLSESRLGLQVGHHLWLRALWVHGLTGSSPSDGVLLTAGLLH